MSEHADYHQRDDQRGKNIADYWPLIVLIAIAILAAVALTLVLIYLCLRC